MSLRHIAGTDRTLTLLPSVTTPLGGNFALVASKEFEQKGSGRGAMHRHQPRLAKFHPLLLTGTECGAGAPRQGQKPFA